MKELSLKKALAFSCPTCGAAPGERCELNTGQPRTDPHRDRRLVAKDPHPRRGGTLKTNAQHPSTCRPALTMKSQSGRRANIERFASRTTLRTLLKKQA